MDKSQRFYIQVLLWLGIWLVLWILEGTNARFVTVNGPAFIFQIVLLAGLIHFAAPRLLFRKEYFFFFMASVTVIALFAFFSSQLGPHPPPPDGPPGRMPGRGPRGFLGQIPTRFFIHLLMLSLSYILATFLETFVFAQNKERETISNKNENLQTELKLLKSQINPHFLFNALNNIYSLSAIDSARTQKSISHLSDMLRYVLYECDQEKVPIAKEITYMKNYIRLFSLKSSKTYPIETDFKVSDGSLHIEPMLLIPFMENALKHGNIEKITDTFIRIQLYAGARGLRFEIENSIPPNPINTDDVGGIGIENVKRRLAILYPGKHNLVITDNGITFKVNLNIQWDEKAEVSGSGR